MEAPLHQREQSSPQKTVDPGCGSDLLLWYQWLKQPWVWSMFMVSSQHKGSYHPRSSDVASPLGINDPWIRHQSALSQFARPSREASCEPHCFKPVFSGIFTAVWVAVWALVAGAAAVGAIVNGRPTHGPKSWLKGWIWLWINTWLLNIPKMDESRIQD